MEQGIIDNLHMTIGHDMKNSSLIYDAIINDFLTKIYFMDIKLYAPV